jgi:hypothetical protein
MIIENSNYSQSRRHRISLCCNQRVLWLCILILSGCFPVTHACLFDSFRAIHWKRPTHCILSNIPLHPTPREKYRFRYICTSHFQWVADFCRDTIRLWRVQSTVHPLWHTSKDSLSLPHTPSPTSSDTQLNTHSSILIIFDNFLRQWAFSLASNFLYAHRSPPSSISTYYNREKKDYER